MKICDFSIQHCKQKATSRDFKLQVLQNKLEQIEQNKELYNFDNAEAQACSIKAEIEEIIEYKTKGTMVRCRVDWNQYGEKMSKYYFNREKQLCYVFLLGFCSPIWYRLYFNKLSPKVSNL